LLALIHKMGVNVTTSDLEQPLKLDATVESSLRLRLWPWTGFL